MTRALYRSRRRLRWAVRHHPLLWAGVQLSAALALGRALADLTIGGLW